MVRLKDIAARLNVSVPLVWLALSDRAVAAKVKPSTRELIVKTAREMGYHPNKAAVSLKSGKKGVIALFIHRHGNPGSEVTGKFLVGAAEELKSSNYNMIIRFFQRDAAFLTALDGPLKNLVDGIIVAGRDHPRLHAKFQEIEKTGLPIVSAYNFNRENESLKNMGTDMEMVGYLPTAHLLDAGCSQLAYFCSSSPLSKESEDAKYKGFLRAHKERGKKINKNLFVDTKNYSMEDGIRCAKLLSRIGEKFDGIITRSDDHALGVIRHLFTHKIYVPQEVKVTGVDDSPLATSLSITSISLNVEKRGHLSVRTLLKMIDQNPVTSIVAPPLLIPTSFNKQFALNAFQHEVMGCPRRHYRMSVMA